MRPENRHAGQGKLCFTALLNGFVFSEAPTDAGMEFNRSPGENQGNQADPCFDGNRTNGTKSLAMASRGNWRNLYLLDLPLKLHLNNYRTFFRLDDYSTRKQRVAACCGSQTRWQYTRKLHNQVHAWVWGERGAGEEPGWEGAEQRGKVLKTGHTAEHLLSWGNIHSLLDFWK